VGFLVATIVGVIIIVVMIALELGIGPVE